MNNGELEGINKQEPYFEGTQEPRLAPTSDLDNKDEMGGFMSIETGEVDISVTEALKDQPTFKITGAETLTIAENAMVDYQSGTETFDTPSAAEAIARSGKGLTSSAGKQVAQQIFPNTPTGYIIGGTNLATPLGLPPLQESDVAAENNNSITIPDTTFRDMLAETSPRIGFGGGNARRTEFSNFLAEADNVVVGLYNRNMPFTSMPIGRRASMIYLEAMCQAYALLPFYALSVIRGEMLCKTKMGAQVKQSLLRNVYNQDVYNSLNEAYKVLAKMYVYDADYLERIERLSGFFPAKRRNTLYITLLMQDILIPLPAPAPKSSPNQTYTLKIPDFVQGSNSVNCVLTVYTEVPNSLMQWIDLFINATPTTVNSVLLKYNNFVSTFKQQFKASQAFWMQLNKQGSLPIVRLEHFLPDFEEVPGYLIPLPKAKEPMFSWAMHERMEHAPYQQFYESDEEASNVKEWVLPLQSESFPSPEAGNLVSGVQSVTMFRPVGSKHSERAWTVKEMLDIGIWANSQRSRAAGSLSFQFQAIPGSSTTGAKLSTGDMLEDVYWGWGYTPRVHYYNDFDTNTSANTSYSAGTTIAISYTRSDSVDVVIGIYGGSRLVSALPGSPIPAARPSLGQTQALYASLAKIAADAEFSVVRQQTADAVGSQQWMYIYYSPYAQTVWLPVPMSIFNGVIANAYGDLLIHAEERASRTRAEGRRITDYK